jgi:hypothetical protein
MEISITDFIICYKDYKIINSLGREKEYIYSSIKNIQDWIDSLYDFINQYQENFEYKKGLLYEVEKEWLFSGYIDHANNLYKTIDKRESISCTHIEEMRKLFNNFNGHDLVYENYSSLLGILVKGYINKIKSISLEEIACIIKMCGCDGNDVKFSQFYEIINNCKYTDKDFIQYFLEEVFSYHNMQWNESSIRKLKRRFDIVYHIFNIDSNSSSMRNTLQKLLLREIDTSYDLDNYMWLLNKIYNNYYKIIDINYIHNNKTSIQLNMPINDYMKIGLNPFVFNPLLTQMLIKAIEEYNIDMLKKRTLPNDLIKLTQAELLQIQEAYRHIRGINGISS